MIAFDERTRRCLAVWLILFSVLIAYSPALRGDFLWLDEMDLTENPFITAPGGLWRMWVPGEMYQYYPLSFTTFWVEHKLWGFNPLGYHFVNIAFHAVVALLFWALLRRLNVGGAWAAAIIFALHPMEVESVAWIAELKNVQSAIFFLASILSYLRSEDTGRAGWYYLSLVLFLAALLSKTSTVMLPAVLVLCLWWRRSPWKWSSAVKLLPFFALSALMAAVCIWCEVNQAGARGQEWSAGIAERIARAGWMLWFYLAKLVVPFNLTHVYPRWAIDPYMVASYFPAVACLIVAAVLWRRRRGWGRPLLMGLGFFAINLFPVLGFFDTFYMRYSFVADRWQYLAGMGVIALLVGTVAWISRRWNRMLKAALVALVAAWLGTLTWRQAHIYQGPEALWTDTIKKNPGAWMAHNNLGNALAGEGRLEEAVFHYKAAIRIKPDYPEPHNNFGNILAGQGRLDEAIAHYREAIRIEPDNDKAHYNLGFALAEQGKYEEAVSQYFEALRIEPENAKVRNNLGVVLSRQGKLDKAIAQYLEALRIMPGDVIAHTNVGILLAKRGRPDEAVAHLREALRIRPDFAYARDNLRRITREAGGSGELPRAVTGQ